MPITIKWLKSLGFKKKIEKIFALTSTSLKKSNLIIVIGGDGFMLNSLKKKGFKVAKIVTRLLIQ